MRFALFTSPESFVDEVDLIERIFDCGLDFLYIDKPRLKDLALERFLLSLPESIRKKSFLCGSPNVADEFGLLGFHETADWFLANESVALRLGVKPSIEVSDPQDFEKLSEALRRKMENIVVPDARALDPNASVFARSDATEIPAGILNAAIVSGIWEFADPVAAWRRLCR